MIIPRSRSQIGPGDLLLLERALEAHASPDSQFLRGLWREEGFEAVLLHPRFELALLWRAVTLDASGLPFLWYGTIFRRLAERGLRDAELADYVTTLVVDFGAGGRAYRIDPFGEHQAEYLADILAAADQGVPGAYQHLGDFALWMAGIFPDRVEGRRQRRGAPGLPYFDAMGSMGYRSAAGDAQVHGRGLNLLLGQMGETFSLVRRTLNEISDSYFFPGQGPDPVGRFLRQVSGL